MLDIGSREFRDPKVFWYAPAKEWRMVVVRAVERKADIYGSPNLKDWTHLSEFGPAGAVGGVWECPDLFPLAVDGDPANVKWVLVINLNPGSIAGVREVSTSSVTSTAQRSPPTTPRPTRRPRHGPAGLRGRELRPWTTTGAAFGDGPASGNVPGQGGVTGFLGDQLANSFHDAAEHRGSDASTGTLTSPEFAITGDYLNFLVGGGNHPHVPGTTLDPTLPTGTVFTDFEGETRGEGWVGTDDFAPSDDPAVIDGPYPGTIGDQQQVTGYQGEQLVNTFTDHDASTGTITSPAFTISSNYINLLVGGGFHPWRDGATDATAVNLVINGEVVATATGSDSEHQLGCVGCVAIPGQSAQIVVVDQNQGG